MALLCICVLLTGAFSSQLPGSSRNSKRYVRCPRYRHEHTTVPIQNQLVVLGVGSMPQQNNYHLKFFSPISFILYWLEVLIISKGQMEDVMRLANKFPNTISNRNSIWPCPHPPAGLSSPLPFLFPPLQSSLLFALAPPGKGKMHTGTCTQWTVKTGELKQQLVLGKFLPDRHGFGCGFFSMHQHFNSMYF